MEQRKKARSSADASDPSEKTWCVYVLKCRGAYLYTGLTNNLEKRLFDHERGTGSKFVRSRRPFELVRVIPCETSAEARKLEAALKKMRRSEKMERLGLLFEPEH